LRLPVSHNRKRKTSGAIIHVDRMSPSAPGSLFATDGAAEVDVDPPSVLVAGAARPVRRARISSARTFARS
jgi:hypothetical protein